MVRVYLSFIVNTLFKRCNLTLIKRLIVRLALRILICYCRREKLHTDLKLKINLTFSMVLLMVEFDGGIASYNVPFIYMYFKFYKTIYNVNLSLKQIPILRTLILL